MVKEPPSIGSNFIPIELVKAFVFSLDKLVDTTATSITNPVSTSLLFNTFTA